MTKKLIDLTPPKEDEIVKELRLLRAAVEDQTSVIMGLCEQLKGRESA